jgi:hypothetical protein
LWSSHILLDRIFVKSVAARWMILVYAIVLSYDDAIVFIM